MRRILIMMIGNKDWMGGVSTYVRNLESALVKLGYEVSVVGNRNAAVTGIELFRKRLSHFVQLMSFGRFGSLISIESIYDVYKSAENKIMYYDIIHTQDAYMTLFVKKYYPGAVTVLTVHGTDYEHNLERISLNRGLKAFVKKYSGYNSALLNMMAGYENAGFAAADRLITVDSNQARLVKEKTGRTACMDVIHNAVDVELLEHLSEDEPIHKSDVPYFLMLRGFSPKNGVGFGVAAFLKWVGDRNVQLLLAGDGHQKNELLNLCKQHVNGRKVVFLGEVNYRKTPALIRNAVATLVPSVPVGGVVEATSLAALESLALGVPVIASNIGGLAEMDQGKGILYLVPPGSVHGISMEMENAYDCFATNTIDRERLKAHVLENYDTKIWIKKIVKVYEDVLREKSRPIKRVSPGGYSRNSF
jgi:glycosyltransferase involved in cell wall biosynthesis